MDASIIIVNWNTRDLLAECLASLFANPPSLQFEVIVVDNASSDDSAAMVQSTFPQVTLIESKVNLGFAGANNKAIAQSRGRYVILLNPDTVVLPQAFDILIEFLDRHPHVGAAGSRLFSADGSLQTSCFPAPTVFRELWRLFHMDAIHPYAEYDMKRWNTDTPREVDSVLGACLVLRRETLDQVGLLDDGFFMFSEEVDLCLRIRRAGWPIFWVPCAQVIHYGGQSTKQVADEMFLQLYQGKVQYFRKHTRPLKVALYKLVLFAAASARLAVAPLAWFERQPKRQRHLKQASQYQKLIYRIRTF